MLRTKPLFIIRKYRRILMAALIVEAVSYVVSLTDSLVAGNAIGAPALAAVGLISPFASLSLFLASVVNSGTVLQYSIHIGRFDRKRALELSSQGLWLGLVVGAAYAGLLFLLREPILLRLGASDEILPRAREYFNVILLYFLMAPLTFVLDNLLIADGGERLSTAANVLTIVTNVALSILFARKWGVRGIAAASVLSRLLFILTVCLHFFDKRNGLRLLFRWSGRDCLAILRCGVVKASTYAAEALLFFVLNFFTIRFFDSETLVLLVMAEKYLGLTTLFIGLSMAAQPLIGTLRGEGNNKALRYLMKTVCVYMAAAGVVLTALSLVFAPRLVLAFGLAAGALADRGAEAIRVLSSTLPFQAVMTMFFLYYYLMGRQLLSFTIGLLKNLLLPLFLAIAPAVSTQSPLGLWAGLAAAPVVTMLAAACIVYPMRRGSDFPFLLPREADDSTYIFCFEVNAKNAAALSQTADRLLREYSVTDRTRFYLGLFFEEILLLIREKNPAAKRLTAECTIMVSEKGVRTILRDSGTLFDITEENVRHSTYQQYVVSNLMTVSEYKTYLTTTGYNRTEMFFPTIRKGLPMKEITLPAALDQIKRATCFVNEYLEEVGCTERGRIQVDVAIDEIFGNIARYAYAPAEGLAVLRVETADEPFRAIITFIDSGKPFNPLLQEAPDLSLPTRERPIGGLGLFMVRKTMDGVFYRREDERNILTIVKNI